MTDQKLQELKDAHDRLQILAKRKDDLWFDLKAGLITVTEFGDQANRLTTECNDIICNEVAPLEAAGYHAEIVCIRLLDGSLQRVGYMFHANRRPWPEK
jgi:hypothetical protein